MAAFLAPFSPFRPAVDIPALAPRRPITNAASLPLPVRKPRSGYFEPGDLRKGHLNPESAGFDRVNAYILGVFSDALYGDLNSYRLLKIAQAVDPGFSRVFPIESSNSQVAVFEHPSCLSVVWRGTKGGDEEGSDWEDNTHTHLTEEVFDVEGYPVRFHHGFWLHVEDAWNSADDGESEGIKAILQRLLGERKRKVFFAGHSLGGSAAVVSAIRFLLDDVGSLDDIAQIVTFGQPRVLAGKGAKELQTEKLGSRYFRYVNETGEFR